MKKAYFFEKIVNKSCRKSDCKVVKFLTKNEQIGILNNIPNRILCNLNTVEKLTIFFYIILQRNYLVFY